MTEPNPDDRSPAPRPAEGPPVAGRPPSPYGLRIALASIGALVFLAGAVLAYVIGAPAFVIFVLVIGGGLAAYNVWAVVGQRKRAIGSGRR